MPRLHLVVTIEPAPAESPPDGLVGRVLELMQSRLAEGWTVASLAKAVGVSRATFARRFLATLGTSPLRYLTALRMKRAAERLAAGDGSLAEIAGEVGYVSEFALSRAFKRHLGVPPRTFRQRVRDGAAITRSLTVRAAA